MDLRITRIKRNWLRRTVMVAITPLMVIAGLALGVTAGALHSMDTLRKSWLPAWRNEPEDPAHPYGWVEVGLLGKVLAVHVPVELLAHAAKFAPFVHFVDPDVRGTDDDPGFRVLDAKKFAAAVGKVLVRDQGPGTLLHDMLDDAMEQVVDDASPFRDGWTWPGAGLPGAAEHDAFDGLVRTPYRLKCKRLRIDGPTPCLCCEGECTGDVITNPHLTAQTAVELEARGYRVEPRGE